MVQLYPRLVAALTDCDVLSQRIAAFKYDVVVSANGVVCMCGRVRPVAREIQAATSCEVVGKVQCRNESEGDAKVPPALLTTLKSGLKVANATVAAGAQTNVRSQLTTLATITVLLGEGLFLALYRN
jgi:hypothetical protein